MLKSMIAVVLFAVLGSYPVSGDTLFVDNFNDGNDSGWKKPLDGAWNVENGEYSRSLVSGANVPTLAWVGDNNWRNYTVETDIKLIDDVPGGWGVLCFRVSDSSNFYYFEYEPWSSAIALNILRGTTYSTLSNTYYSATKNVWYRFKVRVNEDSIFCYINNVLLVQVCDTRLPSGGAGLASWHAHTHFDNFTVTAPAPPTLVAYYPFTGNAADSSGRGPDGIVVGPNLITDRFGNANSAYVFDGSNDYITAGTVDFKVPLSVSLWFKSSSVNSVYRSVLAWVNETYPQQGIQLFADGTGKFDVRVGFGSDRKTLSIIDGDNTWHHLVATRDVTNSLKVYVDGVLEVSSSNTSALGSNHTLYIGRTYQSNEFFKGAIDDIRIYNYAISATQADSLHNITSGPPNNAPQFISSPVTTATEDSAYTYAITAVDVDLDDTITLTLDSMPAGMTLSSQVVSWRPANANVGSNRVVVRARDNHGAFTLQKYTLVVANINDTPVIVSAPPLIATQNLLYQYQLTVSDPDAGDTRSYLLSIAPAGMAVNGSGLISWTPTQFQIGTNNVTVTVRDGSLAADTQSWTITVSNINDAPVITTLTVDTATEGIPYSDTVRASDPDGNTVFWSLLQAPAGLTIGLTTGILVWTPGDSQTGSQTVKVRATDGVLSDTSTFTLHVRNLNDPPVITSIPVVTARQDQAYSYSVTVSDPDLGDHTAYALVTSFTGITISPTGRITWTPNAAQVGMCSVTVVVQDDSAASDTQSFQLTVENVNDAPMITTISLDTAFEDLAYLDTLAVFDPDGNMIFWYLIQGPDSLKVDLLTGVMTWLPLDRHAGNDTVTVRATDGISSDTATLVIHVVRVNDPPRITGTFPATLQRDSLYIIPLSAFDEEKDRLTWTIPDKPSNMQIIDTSVIWVPGAAQVGKDTLTIIVSDGSKTDTLVAFIVVTEPTGSEDLSVLPLECSLSGTPNPFNPTVAFRIGIPLTATKPMTLQIFGIQGRIHQTWRIRGAGFHQVAWNAADASGKPLSTGTYIARLYGEGKVLQQKLLLLK